MIIELFGAIISKINWVDILFLFFLVYFIFMGTDFITALCDLFSFILTILLSYKVYLFFANLLIIHLSMAHGIARAVGFFIAWFIIETLIFIVVRLILSKLPHHVYSHHINRYLAFIPSTIQAMLFFLLIIVTIFSLPVKATVKESILNSNTGPYLISVSQFFEGRIKDVFGGAANETLNFLTIREGDESGVNLGFKAPANVLTEDLESEQRMFTLVNRERVERSLPALTDNTQLQETGRQYAREMFMNGFFAHESQVDGSTPSMRAERNGIPWI